MTYLEYMQDSEKIYIRLSRAETAYILEMYAESLVEKQRGERRKAVWNIAAGQLIEYNKDMSGAYMPFFVSHYIKSILKSHRKHIICIIAALSVSAAWCK